MASCWQRQGALHKGPGATLCTRILTVAELPTACSLGWGPGACPGRSSPTWAHCGPSAKPLSSPGCEPPSPHHWPWRRHHARLTGSNSAIFLMPQGARRSFWIPSRPLGAEGGWVVLTPTFLRSNPQLYRFYPVGPPKGHRAAWEADSKCRVGHTPPPLS